MSVDSIPRRLLDRGRSAGNDIALLEMAGGSWKEFSYSDYAGMVRTAARAMMALGLQPDDKICILAFNCVEWVVADVGAMAAGGVPAGIYETCSADEVAYIISHSEAPIVFVESAEQFAKIASTRDQLPNLRHVVTFRACGPIEDDLVMDWDAFMAKADDIPDADLDARLDAIDPGAAGTFIYTSGTTGPPKAVMLSHKNLTWTADAALKLVDLGNTDCNLSYLPLSHIAEQMFTVHAPITAGSRVYFAESREKLKDNLIDVQPTIIFGVPRVWEKFHAGVSAKLGQATGVKAKLVAWALAVGREVNAQRNSGGGEPSGLLGLKYKIAGKLIYAKVRPLLGLGRARVCVTGAAPIAPEILEFFAGLDVVIREVYGQSEDSGPTTFNRPGATKFGTVGPAVDGVDVKIAEDGEIVVKGPNVFLGYYKDPAATADTLVDGWLQSGDLGAFDSDGFLSITGRKKDIIITAGGKNIAPKNIEAALKNLDLVSQAVVIGDRRKFLSAIITLDPEAVERFAGKGGGPPHEDAGVRAELQTGVDSVNAMFARVEHIRKFTVLPRDLTVEDRELTPTLKIKRRIVNENWSDVIEAMYQD